MLLDCRTDLAVEIDVRLQRRRFVLGVSGFGEILCDSGKGAHEHRDRHGARHAGERVLVFSEYNALVEEVSQRFCIPHITHKTATEERRLILERFRDGRYLRLVTGRVLNEGVDIPDCGVAIIVSGNATRREYIQRLGRVLRPKPGEAILYELISRRTTEGKAAHRRRQETGERSKREILASIQPGGKT